MDADKARQLLDAEKARLTELRDEQRERIAESIEGASAELSSFDQHPADTASETQEREQDQSLLEGFEAQLAEIDAAYGRLDAGTYGVCEGTGEPIPDERLEAIPQTRYTAAYQQQLESGSRAGTARSDAVTPPR